MIRLGIDFDNTLVEYDAVFHNAAAAKGLIPHDLAVNKTTIRDYIQLDSGPEAWTMLQGEVYGKHIETADPFEGAIEAIAECKSRGAQVVLISHKTELAVIDPKWNLQAAARNWLKSQELYNQDRDINVLQEAWFEETREGKYARITSQACDFFLDDLPEFLLDAQFPESCRPILFDPANAHAENELKMDRIRSWRELPDLIDRLESLR